MELDWIWKAIVIIVGGTFLLRIAGRKSISQMTLAQTVIMIGIGSLLIQPVAGKNIWVTLGVGAILVCTLILMEYGQIKFDFIENLITGKAKVLIENGSLNEDQLRKMRLTADQLEIQLRQRSVTSMNDVQYATMGPNGQVGIVLKESAQPSTKGDLQQLKQEIENLRNLIGMILPASDTNTKPAESSKVQNNIFKEVSAKEHEKPISKQLQ